MDEDRKGDASGVEFGVPVWGGGSSETDLMAFMPAGVIAIEAKTDEPFDDVVGTWVEKQATRNPRSPHHRRAIVERYAKAFGVVFDDLLGIRYQLLHRALSAALAARRVGARRAWMVVQSFPTSGRVPRCSSQRDDFNRFVALIGHRPVIEGTSVRLAWVDEP